MKKIFSVILLSAFCAGFNMAAYAADDVEFIYINGSNNNNEKMRQWYIKGVTKLHPVLKKTFEKDKNMLSLFSNNSSYKIGEEPKIFFWGDMSKNDLEFVHSQLDLSKAFSPTIAYQVRAVIASYLHDAIWVQKSHHMLPIVQNLNNMVKEQAKTGKKVVIYGYSAGTFITYEYLFNTLPYLNLEKLFENIDVTEDMREFVKANPRKNTCIAALAAGKIGVVTTGGHLAFDKYEKTLKENYLQIDTATDEVCSPPGTVKGIVNFASPLVLFYSDLSDPDYELTYYNKLLLKYIMENGLFMLTVNFREDPLGFPSSRNLTAKDMESIINIKIENPTGFIYDNSSVWSKRPFFLAHTSYWSARKTFSKAVVKSIADGYRFQYDEKFQNKVRKHSRKYEL